MALLLIGAPIWFFSWRILQDVLPDPAEKESYLRLGILYLLSLGGVVVVLTVGGSLIYMILRYAVGDGKSFAEFVQDIGGPISLGVPFGVIWAYYGKWLNQQLQLTKTFRAVQANKDCIFTFSRSLVLQRHSLQ